MAFLANGLLLLLALSLLYLVRRAASAYRNYLAAKRTGLPVWVHPFGVGSPPWIFFSGVFLRVFGRYEWVHRIDSGWNQRQKLRPYEQLGSRAFWIVTPDYKELFVADPLACEDILRRCRAEFKKNPTQYTLLDIYGLNVVTANGKAWERHRRITAPPFNERVSETVWDESARQAEAARRAWLHASSRAADGGEGGGEVRSTQEDTTRIAFNVLSTAGFGISFGFDDVSGQGPSSSSAAAAATNDKDDDNDTAEDSNAHHMRYRQALFTLLNDMGSFIAWIILRRMGWPESAMWGGIKAVGVAKHEYGAYLHQMIQEEREEIQKSSGRSSSSSSSAPGGDRKAATLMSSLIRVSDQGSAPGADHTGQAVSAAAAAAAAGKVKGKEAGGAGGGGGPALTDEEVAGNLFILNIAGHDTTANALNFAITLLAIDPEWQEWLAEEIDAVVGEDQSSLKYAVVFPKLHRCLAVMHEVLRMYGPVPVTPRWTGDAFHTLTIDGREYTIPPGADIKLDLVSLHHDKKAWGDDADSFRPDRWLTTTTAPSSSSSSSPRTTTTTTTTTATRPGAVVVGAHDRQPAPLISPAPGTFLPWTGGPRVCPGKKFSQVEFTSVLLRLFRGGARVRVAEEAGESAAQARERARRIAGDPEISITLKMRGSEEIGLRWYVK